MRRNTAAGLIVALAIAGGAATLAQSPIPDSPQPPGLISKVADHPQELLPEPAAPGLSLPDASAGAFPDPLLAAAPAGPTTDDPMVAVESFVQRSRKEAEDAVGSLTGERDRLRDRLKKVEAALARWEEVSHALAREGREAAPSEQLPSAPSVETPSVDLRPIDDTPR